MLNVTLFGGASIAVNTTILRPDLGPSGRMLAFYLFEFPGRSHRRERLADLFWRDLDAEKSRSALNTAIWRIRKILELGSEGGAHQLMTTGNDVILHQSISLQVDTHRLQQAARRAAARTDESELSETELQELSAAVEGYNGPFLDGYDEDWVLQERERLHCLFVRTAFELMRVAAIQREYERALDFGRRILALDGLRESIQRDVMLLLVLDGQRVEAIRSYQRFAEGLRAELDIDPMPETKQLYSDIRSGKIFGELPNYVSDRFKGRKNRPNTGALRQANPQ